MKKIILTCILTVLACVLAIHVMAVSGMIQITVDPSIKILVNGEEFKPKDVTGKEVMTFVYDGTTYAPLRALAEAYGLEVGYNADLKMATVNKPGKNQNSDQQSTLDSNPTKYTEGQYKIGKDMPAGVYVFYPAKRGEDGYFCCTTDANGDDILSNDHFETYAIYEVFSGEFLELSDAYAVPYSEAEIPDTNYSDGTYIVGVHIPAGEYKIVATVKDRSGSYNIYSEPSRDHIVAIEYFYNSGYISLSEGEVVILERCRIIVE